MRRALQDYPGKSEAEYETMWWELKRVRESEVNGVVADLNCSNESRYWYSTAQTTKVRSS